MFSPRRDTPQVLNAGGQLLPVIGTVDSATGRVSLNPLGMVLLLSQPRRKPTTPGSPPTRGQTNPTAHGEV